MESIAYPTNTLYSFWEHGFKFSQAFTKEMRDKFPTWDALHNAIKRDDQGQMWGLLFDYRDHLAIFTPQEIIDAADSGEIHRLVERARQAVEFKTFLVDLEKRYFPEQIQKREEANRRALESYEY